MEGYDPSKPPPQSQSNSSAGAPPGNASAQAIPAHLMQMMTNPALAAATAASPLFPPAAMMSNPGAYLSMPEAFVAGAMQAQRQMRDNNGNVPLLPNPSMNPFSQNNIMAMPILSSIAPPLDPTESEQDRKKRANNPTDMTSEERAQQSRLRNREHARSTRLRKKAYVAKLKELVEGLHTERTEEVRQRRVAVQHLAEMQNIRRSVVRTFLRYHAMGEADERKWQLLTEDDFWLKQPVTPYRSFRSSDIEKNYRVCRSLHSVICDAASLSVMIESIGSRSPRWMQLKREEFLILEEAARGSKKRPSCIVRQESRLRHAVSSLSSSSGSSGEERDLNHKRAKLTAGMLGAATTTQGSDSGDGTPAKKVSSSSGSSSDSQNKKGDTSGEFHDYHAKPLPDPKLNDSDRSTSPSLDDSPEESNSGSNLDTKQVTTDSSSGEDSAAAIAEPRLHKRRKVDNGLTAGEAARAAVISKGHLPPNIAKKGGIPHNIQPAGPDVGGNGMVRLSLAPAVPLPPFAGIGKRKDTKVGHASVTAPEASAREAGGSSTASDGEFKATNFTAGEEPANVANDTETSSSSYSVKAPQSRASYHFNEDDMIIMDDVLMCPFTFRSQDAVLCGALSECVMPGMLRAAFSERNKLRSLELVYDAMGFMQQLERASGNEGTAQIVPGSLEMALAPNSNDARVITTASAPFFIVNVNDVWTQIAGYTQLEAEGKEYLSLLEGDGTVGPAHERKGKPVYNLEDVSRGRSACTTNIHYDKKGHDFIEFVCSYPLANASGEITHILHVSKELPSLHESMMESAV